MLPSDEAHRPISRHHCLLDINPPDIRVRDFGSLNGTHVNGHTIGRRPRGRSRREAAGITFPEYDLQDGDELQLGKTTFRVGVYVPPICSGCTREIPEAERSKAETAPGVYHCRACRRLAATAPHQSTGRGTVRTCVKCGRDVSGEVRGMRVGDYVCKACKSDPLRIVRRLLDAAKTRRASCGRSPAIRSSRRSAKAAWAPFTWHATTRPANAWP